MKKLILVIAVLALLGLGDGISGIAEATGDLSCDGPFAGILNKCIPIDDTPEVTTVLGAKFDAPNLIRFTDNLTLGIEGGKDMYTNPFSNSSAWIEDDKGYFGYIKITWTGTFFDFRRK